MKYYEFKNNIINIIAIQYPEKFIQITNNISRHLPVADCDINPICYGLGSGFTCQNNQLVDSCNLLKNSTDLYKYNLSQDLNICDNITHLIQYINNYDLNIECDKSNNANNLFISSSYILIIIISITFMIL
jgi:hypothetical protein